MVDVTPPATSPNLAELAADAIELRELLFYNPVTFKGCSGLFAVRLRAVLDAVPEMVRLAQQKDGSR